MNYFLKGAGIIALLLSIFRFVSFMENRPEQVKYTDIMLRAQIRSNCDFEEFGISTIDLKDALDTDFDTMYMFDHNTRSYEIRKIIGTRYSNKHAIRRGAHRIILLKNRKVVYQDTYQQNFTYLIRPKPDEDTDTQPYQVFTSSLFWVIPISEGEEGPVRYILRETNREEIEQVYESLKED